MGIDDNLIKREDLGGLKIEKPNLEQSEKPPELSTVEHLKNVEIEISKREIEIADVGESILKTGDKLKEVRGGLGLPPAEEDPPSILFGKDKLATLQREKDSLEAQKQDLINRPSSTGESKDDEDVDGSAERVAQTREREFLVDISKSFRRLSTEVQNFEDSLKLNKFRSVQFPAEDFKLVIKDESVDFKKAAEILDGLQSDLRRDFMPKDEREKLAIEPHNFRRVMDSLDNLKGVLIGVRNKIDKRPILDNETEIVKVSESLKGSINTLRKKMEDIADVESTLRRYAGR